MKRIHITESQLKYCIKMLKEGVTNVDLTTSYTNDGKQFGSNCKKTLDDAKRNGLNPDKINATINGSAMKEGRVYTKKQLKESRLRKLKSETKRIIKKKNLR